MIQYIRAHWRGELSLVQSYWVNTFMLGVFVTFGSRLLEEPMSQLRIETVAVTGLVIMVVVSIVTVWQLVGVWRSATNTAATSGENLWPRVAKAVVIIGGLAGGFNVATATGDLFKILHALNEPNIASYSVERLGDTDLILTGAINDSSVDDVINSLNDPLIEILRINSQGGIIEPAVRLARYIRDNDIFVMAEGQCDSACVFILAASPYAAVYPGTQVVFHQSEKITDFSNPDFQKELQRYLKEVEKYDREFGIPEWVTEKLKQERFWSATHQELFEMGLLSYVYDPDSNEFVPADAFCARQGAVCLARVPTVPIDQ